MRISPLFPFSNKIKKAIGHPVIVIVIFLVSPVQGAEIQGLYLMKVINNLSFGNYYQVAALAAIFLLLVTWIFFKRKYNNGMELFLSNLGLYTLISSYISYCFTNSPEFLNLSASYLFTLIARVHLMALVLTIFCYIDYMHAIISKQDDQLKIVN